MYESLLKKVEKGKQTIIQKQHKRKTKGTTMIINATNLIAGRLATVVAKKALLGEEITIINCENAVITGRRDTVLAQRKQRRDRGTPTAGPYCPRMPDQMLKRMIRGMLPYKQERGEAAFKRIMCYRGVPIQLQDKVQQATTIKEADAAKLPYKKFVTLGEIAKFLGANWYEG